MIEGYCRTNLDGYDREEWPIQFAAVPRIGERVAAKSGRSLKVVGVTHRMRARTRLENSAYETPPGPCIDVELNK